MPHPVRLGDKTSHGGSVAAATSHTDFRGKPIACVGDTCACPLPGHSVCVIVEGSSLWSINGKAVALHGHKTSCGASLIASLGEMDSL